MDDKVRDKYLQRRFGLTLEEYKAMLAFQKEACGICCRPKETFTRSLSVDHDHSINDIKVETKKMADKQWYATAVYLGIRRWGYGTKKHLAIRDVRKLIRRASVRGALCPFCNRGLRYYADDPTRLANAAEYLRKHQQTGETK